MNDEIKEIIESSRKIIKSNRENGFDRIIMLGDDIDKLLDYITNLQQENERLKEENKHIFANVNDDELLRSNAMNWAEAQDYKSRIEKAIPMLKELNIKLKGILNIGIDIKEISDIEDTLDGRSDK